MYKTKMKKNEIGGINYSISKVIIALQESKFDTIIKIKK